MALLPQDPQKQKKLLIGLLPILVAFAYYQFYHTGRSLEVTELALPPEPVAKRLTLHIGHGEPQHRRATRRGDLARVVDRQDMGMLEAGGQVDLIAQGPVGAARAAPIGSRSHGAPADTDANGL